MNTNQQVILHNAHLEDAQAFEKLDPMLRRLAKLPY